MPSPLAHAGVAVAFYVAGQRAAVRGWDVGVVAFASFAPDLDLLVGWIAGDPIGWHRGPSHSLVGALVLGVAISLFARGNWARVSAVIASLLHVPMDWSTGVPGAPAKYGVPWRWPWEDRRFIDPDPFFGSFDIDREGFLLNLLTVDALRPWGIELATVGAAGLCAMALRWVQRR